MKQLIRNKAAELGFLDIGFAGYEPLDKEAENYEKWLENGNHADMEWMERNIAQRWDIKKIMPDVQSIIVLAYNYYTGEHYPEKDELKPNEGLISRYAWNYDYHDIVKQKARDLAEFITEKVPSHNYKCYVDTGPVLEKIWAEKAGIGWQGKNSLILSKKFGSYFFIGVILSNLSFEADEPVKDYCMTCTKCMDGCPTGAITEPKIVDSRKCISYWTIESDPDEVMPEEVAENADNRIFGCDICQEVCPWNRNLPPVSEDGNFHPRNDDPVLTFEFIDALNQSDFTRRFRKSPVKRAKLQGLKRNAATVLIPKQ